MSVHINVLDWGYLKPVDVPVKDNLDFALLRLSPTNTFLGCWDYEILQIKTGACEMGQQPCKLNLSLMMEHLSDFICLSGLQGVGGTEIGIFKSHMIVNLLCTETMNDRSQVTGHIAEEQFVSSLI